MPDPHLTAALPVQPAVKDFAAFLAAFPASIDGQPPGKKARVKAGFQQDRSFYDRWRCRQYKLRQDYLLSSFTHRKPTLDRVSRLIQREGWTANHPSPEDILDLWKPATKLAVEQDPVILKSIKKQKWKGLAIKDFAKGQGVVATRPFSKGDIVCDYHGKVITAEAGRTIMANLTEEAGYMFFFKAGERNLCIDAQTFPCACHPTTNTIGRLINHSRKNPRLKPLHCVMQLDGEEKDVILFKALTDIPVDCELTFDYGVNRKSFRGEGLDLEWLDE